MFISHLKKRKFLDFTSPKRCHPISLFTSRAISPLILLPLCPHANQPLLSAPAPTRSPLQAAPGKVPGASRLPTVTLSAAVDRGGCSLSSSEPSLVLLFVTLPSPGLPPPSVDFLHLPSCHPPEVLCLRPSSLPPMHFYPL